MGLTDKELFERVLTLDSEEDFLQLAKSEGMPPIELRRRVYVECRKSNRSPFEYYTVIPYRRSSQFQYNNIELVLFQWEMGFTANEIGYRYGRWTGSEMKRFLRRWAERWNIDLNRVQDRSQLMGKSFKDQDIQVDKDIDADLGLNEYIDSLLTEEGYLRKEVDDLERSRATCPYCKNPQPHYVPDGCLGLVKPDRVLGACCGHGQWWRCYINFYDGSILRGRSAIKYLQENVPGWNPPPPTFAEAPKITVPAN